MSKSVRRRPEQTRPPIADERCVHTRYLFGGQGEPHLVTIGDALACLSGHYDILADDFAIAVFHRTGWASSPHATYRVRGTPEEVQAKLAAHRDWTEALRKFTPSAKEPDFLAAANKQQIG